MTRALCFDSSIQYLWYQMIPYDTLMMRMMIILIIIILSIIIIINIIIIAFHSWQGIDYVKAVSKYLWSGPSKFIRCNSIYSFSHIFGMYLIFMFGGPMYCYVVNGAWTLIPHQGFFSLWSGSSNIDTNDINYWGIERQDDVSLHILDKLPRTAWRENHFDSRGSKLRGSYWHPLTR